MDKADITTGRGQVKQVPFHWEETVIESKSSPTRPDQDVDLIFATIFMPMMSSFACTIAKAQSVTIPTGVFIKFDGMFGAGTAYTALSRVPSLDLLYLEKFDDEIFGPDPRKKTHAKQTVYAEEKSLVLIEKLRSLQLNKPF